MTTPKTVTVSLTHEKLLLVISCLSEEHQRLTKRARRWSESDNAAPLRLSEVVLKLGIRLKSLMTKEEERLAWDKMGEDNLAYKSTLKVVEFPR